MLGKGPKLDRETAQFRAITNKIVFQYARTPHERGLWHDAVDEIRALPEIDIPGWDAGPMVEW